MIAYQRCRSRLDYGMLSPETASLPEDRTGGCWSQQPVSAYFRCRCSTEFAVNSAKMAQSRQSSEAKGRLSVSSFSEGREGKAFDLSQALRNAAGGEQG